MVNGYPLGHLLKLINCYNTLTLYWLIIIIPMLYKYIKILSTIDCENKKQYNCLSKKKRKSESIIFPCLLKKRKRKKRIARHSLFCLSLTHKLNRHKTARCQPWSLCFSRRVISFHSMKKPLYSISHHATSVMSCLSWGCQDFER